MDASPPARRPKVVIVGAGFGGLTAAVKLAKAEVDVTVIDRHNYHCFQPLLYQVATAELSPADIAWPIRHVLRRQKNARVLLGTVQAIDLENRKVVADTVTLDFDELVLATGATHSYFGNDEWEKSAPGLKRIEDATIIRRRLLMAFERAELSDDPAERERLLTFAIVGAGPTGVELAGAIIEVARQVMPSEFRRIDLRTARVILIEAGPRVLPAFPESLSDYTRRSLEDMGVEVMTDTRVTKVDETGVDLEHGRLDAATVIWAAGVVASGAGRWIGAESDRAGRVIVEPNLSVPGRPNVFVIGDTAAVKRPDGSPVPGIAPAAKQMGAYVADVIASRAREAVPPPPFRYVHQGDVATIGRRAAVITLPYVNLKGMIAWLFWCVAHIYFLIGTRNRIAVAFKWVWDFMTFQRGARLITDQRDQI
ncbi:NAD(P)/FAD-dependent oxidoreductase [Hansschlegelia zhihuaiae]|uniref:NADH:ubiquinone reductase (non-electrogenic) n=1 Tax=Hansschlegelia zhihuaiae TaxID=405005 RepID=A0A4V1KI60_9HYPH|nr:NAD(P)/FAD-dependent oxidoreductase [Hansschlegelia zhihuaiae]RXF69562.1 NAD(P)/FAD-dependent oxidoreductase [Hansschlegelia zhihuaiae]